MKTSLNAVPYLSKPTLVAHVAAVVAALIWAGSCSSSLAQIVQVGGTARPFTVSKRGPGTPIRLQDYAGQVLVLDFFAYWCGPCRTSSPDLETNVRRYYESRGGNPNGVPVTVLPVNIETGNEGATDSFIRAAGLDVVANDYSSSAYSQFETGYIPLFVIINGLVDADGLKQWQVLYRDSGYPGAEAIRRIIDPIRSLQTTSPPKFTHSPSPQLVAVGDALRLECNVQGASPIRLQWYRDGQLLAGATNQTLVIAAAQMTDAGEYRVAATNAIGGAQSSPAQVRVATEGTPVSFASQPGIQPIPDGGQVESVVTVPSAVEILRFKVSLKIKHSYPGDLEVVLQSPAGTEVLLRSADGKPGGTGIVLDHVLKSEFSGENAQGSWTLRVADRFEEDTGTLESWSIDVIPPASDVGSGFPAWITSFPGLTTDLQAPSADPDRDGLVNFVEYLMQGRSPTVAERGPLLRPVAEAPGHFEYQLDWRTGIDRAPVEVEWSEDLAGGRWSASDTAGSPVVVNQAQSGRTTVRIPKDRNRLFLRLRVRGS
ncbi:MAG: proprotein convertase P-domain-containing protein [Verrucomicrobiales bacterium]|nr:proprotein convertase P-domain-containing protein [Verrucomicrobiales bacterium]